MVEPACAFDLSFLSSPEAPEVEKAMPWNELNAEEIGSQQTPKTAETCWNKKLKNT